MVCTARDPTRFRPTRPVPNPPKRFNRKIMESFIILAKFQYMEEYLNSDLDMGLQTRVAVSSDCGDGTSLTVNIHEDARRISIAGYNYSVPGIYYPAVTIINYIRDCSYPPTTGNPVIVDFGIPNFIIIGKPISLLLHPDAYVATHFVIYISNYIIRQMKTL